MTLTWILVISIISLAFIYLAVERHLRSKKIRKVFDLREKLASAFSPETAHPSTNHHYPPSKGHCAAVALVVNAIFDGKLVSTTYQGQSHWYNEIEINGEPYRVDLTGDQFGFDRAVRISKQRLYASRKIRSPEEVDEETKDRAFLLAERADLPDAAWKIEERF